MRFGIVNCLPSQKATEKSRSEGDGNDRFRGEGRAGVDWVSGWCGCPL